MNRTGRTLAVMAVALAAGVSTGTAQAVPIEVDTAETFGIFGPAPTSPIAAQKAGDVNGDGIEDTLVGTPGFPGQAGVVGSPTWVVFGRRAAADVNLAGIGTRGFQVVASGPRELSSVAPIGDVNGDGRDDLSVVLGSELGDQRAKILLGAVSTATVDVGRVSARTIALPDDLTLAPRGTGDINGDGYDDVFALRLIDPAVIDVRGEYLFGARTLSAGAGPAQVSARLARFVGDGVADILGDVNDDGIDDLGEQREDASGTVLSVVFGRRWTPGTIDLSSAPRLTFSLVRGWRSDSFALYGAGDVNGDGKADVAVSEQGNSDGAPGTIFVAYGRGPGSLDLNAMGAAGLTITGFVGSDNGATGVATSVGDTDGNGRDDLVLQGGGVPTQLLGGRGTGGSVDATQPDSSGARVIIEGAGRGPARSVSGVGDLDRNGGDDLATFTSDEFNNNGHVAIIGGRDVTAPRITGFGLSNTTFRVGATPASVPRGTTISGTLSEDVRLQLSLRRADGTRVTTVAFPARRGLRSLFFDGKVNGVPLAPGGYRLTPVLTDGGGNQTVGSTVTFTVVR